MENDDVLVNAAKQLLSGYEPNNVLAHGVLSRIEVSAHSHLTTPMCQVTIEVYVTEAYQKLNNVMSNLSESCGRVMIVEDKNG